MVTRQDKRLAVGRLGALVEQIEALVSKDLQVILVYTPYRLEWCIKSQLSGTEITSNLCRECPCRNVLCCMICWVNLTWPGLGMACKQGAEEGAFLR